MNNGQILIICQGREVFGRWQRGEHFYHKMRVSIIIRWLGKEKVRQVSQENNNNKMWRVSKGKKELHSQMRKGYFYTQHFLPLFPVKM